MINNQAFINGEFTTPCFNLEKGTHQGDLKGGILVYTCFRGSLWFIEK